MTILTEKELCRRLKCSRVTAYRLRRDGQLSHIKYGRSILYTEEHLEEFLKRKERKAAKAIDYESPALSIS
jgi:excisionase family DNA binding protein